MDNLTIRLLDKSNPDELAAYEKALYLAFSSIQDRSLDLIWNMGKKRIVTKIPYCSQQIMIAETNNSIIAGLALNFNMQEKLQLEYLGFQINKSEDGICEALLLFNTQVSVNSHLVLYELQKHLLSFLKSQHIRKVYGTCSKRRIRGYRSLGFRDIDTREVNNVPEYLLVYDI